MPWSRPQNVSTGKRSGPTILKSNPARSETDPEIARDAVQELESHVSYPVTKSKWW